MELQTGGNVERAERAQEIYNNLLKDIPYPIKKNDTHIIFTPIEIPEFKKRRVYEQYLRAAMNTKAHLGWYLSKFGEVILPLTMTAPTGFLIFGVPYWTIFISKTALQELLTQYGEYYENFYKKALPSFIFVGFQALMLMRNQQEQIARINDYAIEFNPYELYDDYLEKDMSNEMLLFVRLFPQKIMRIIWGQWSKMYMQLRHSDKGKMNWLPTSWQEVMHGKF